MRTDSYSLYPWRVCAICGSRVNLTIFYISTQFNTLTKQIELCMKHSQTIGTLYERGEPKRNRRKNIVVGRLKRSDEP